MKKYINGLLIIVVVLLIIIFLAEYANKTKSTNSIGAVLSGHVIIPDVSGMTLEEAKDILESIDLKVAKKIIYESSNAYIKDHIVRTEPKIGSEVKKDSEIKIVICNGESGYTISEDLLGKSYEDARNILEENYIKVKRDTVKDQGSKYTEGTVARIVPSVNTKLSKGDTVTLYINEMDVTYPDFTDSGFISEDIENWCKKQGVVLELINVKETRYKKDKVFGQSIKPGTRISFGQVLTVYVAE